MKMITITAWKKCVGLVIEAKGNLVLEIEDEIFSCFSPILLENTKLIKEPLGREISKIGLLADSISGAYGKSYFERYYVNNFGLPPSTLDRLSFISAQGLGALEYSWDDKTNILREEPHIDITISLSNFMKKSLDIYNNSKSDENNEYLARLIAKSNSGAGGARAKAVLDYNPLTKEIHLSYDKSTKDGYVKCIIKFNNATNSADKEIYNQELITEYIYYLLAKKSGMNISKCWLEKDENSNFYFITERFDIDKHGEKCHMHSLAGLLSHDASSFTLGYESLFRVGKFLSVPQDNQIQMFMNMIFNLVYANRDDHSRNFSFLMDKDCEWRYSPAYDLTYSASNHNSVWHQLTIDGKASHKVRSLGLNKIAKLCGVKNPLQIISDMIEIKNRWLRDLCQEYEIQSVADAIFKDTKGLDKIFYKETK